MEVHTSHADSFFAFAFTRFAVDLHRYLRARFTGPLVVAFSTQTEYFDADLGTHVVEVPRSKRRKNETVVPAVCFSIANMDRDQVIFSNDFVKIPTTRIDEAGHRVPAVQRFPPIELANVSLDMKIFETSAPALLRLQAIIFNYFKRFPYLFIPEDISDFKGVEDEKVLRQLIKEWWALPEGQLSVPGFFIEQTLPHTTGLFRADLKADISNVKVGSTTVTLINVPIADDDQEGETLSMFIEGDFGLYVESGEEFFDGEDEIVFPLPFTDEGESA